MPTFKEQQQLLTEYQHKKAVWEALFRFLDDNFVAHDGGEPKKAIMVHDCLIQVVPQDLLEDILNSISKEKILPLQQALDQINNQEITVAASGGN